MGTWGGLTSRERAILTEHFLSDGIDDPAFVFAFLPQFFANCRANQVVGLPRALIVLIELIGLVRAEQVTFMGEATITVNLSDLANFAHDVKCSAVFEAVVRHVKIAVSGPDMAVAATVSLEHWQCVSQTAWQDDPRHEVASMLRRLDRKVEATESNVDSLIHWLRPPSTGQPQLLTTGPTPSLDELPPPPAYTVFPSTTTASGPTTTESELAISSTQPIPSLTSSEKECNVEVVHRTWSI